MGYKISRMRFNTKQVSLYELLQMIEIGRFDYRSYFRLPAKWSTRYKSQLIETILLGLPIEEIWAEEDKFGQINILSGIDVISTLIDFKEDKFGLTGLRYLRNLEGYSFHTFEYLYRDDLFQTTINLNVIDYNVNPLLKCLFLKNKNKEKSSRHSSQNARNFCFTDAEERLRKFAVHIYENYTNRQDLSRRKLGPSFIIALQEDILLLTLVKCLKGRRLIESIKHSRRNYFNNNEDDYGLGFSELDISYEDQLDIALDKIMFQLNMRNEYLIEELNTILDDVYHLLLNNHQYMSQVGIINSLQKINTSNLLQGVFGFKTQSIRNDIYLWQLDKKLGL